MTDTMEQLDTILLLQAMYPLPEELVLNPDTATFVEDPTGRAPSEFGMTLRVSLDAQPGRTLELFISLTTDSNMVKIVPRQPAWLNRLAFETLWSSTPEYDPGISSSEYILESLETLKITASDLLLEQAALDAPEAEEKEIAKEIELERVWFWFPMLSTREKRKDLVEYAPRYGLTGFVLAGEFADTLVKLVTERRKACIALFGRGRERSREVHVRYQVQLLVGHPTVPKEGETGTQTGDLLASDN
jgi:hypothetical protein